jgi:hypothetical protein
MILEYAQLLSTCYFVLNPDLAKLYLNDNLIYKPTHINHRSNRWVRKHYNNYMYVCTLALQLCKEWRYRYNHQKIHQSEPKLQFLLNNPPPNINKESIIKTKYNPKSLSLPLPQAMPDEYKSKKRSSVFHTVQAYRRYYKSPHKQHIVSWTRKVDGQKINLDQPIWWSI